MTATASCAGTSPVRSHRSRLTRGKNCQRATRAPASSTRRTRKLGRYEARPGTHRELIARAGLLGSVLVIDRELFPGGEERLLAHLPADEPFENAAIVCRHYLEEARPGCRLVRADDARAIALPIESDGSAGSAASGTGEVVAGRGGNYELQQTRGRMAIAQLRWMRYPHGDVSHQGLPISLREAVGEMESYEPFCSMTRAALIQHGDDPKVSITVLRAELERVQTSPIVLNRGLREAVLAVIQRERLSMSEIAIRCGRLKRDCNGNESGETSWLARRLGLLPEGGKQTPTPWIHSEVLGLIARNGITISPREVELG